MPLIILIIGIAVLFFLIVKVKLNGFLSLMVACMFVGLAEGLPLGKVVSVIETGFGGTLGHLGLIIGFGAIFGRIMADGGGAQRIAETLINTFGRKNVAWAVAITSFIVGITLFWEVSFIVLIPIVFTVVIAGRFPILDAGIPMLAAITVSHCFLPPHPGPVAVCGIFDANVGLVLIYGLIIGIPTLFLSGPLYVKFIHHRGIFPEINEKLGFDEVFKEEELPGFGISVFTALIPVFLIIIAMIVGFMVPADSTTGVFFKFIGSTDVALAIALIVSFYTFGIHRGRSISDLMATSETAVKTIAMILFIMGGGGAFKEVIVQAGVGNYVAEVMSGIPVSPLLLAWAIASIIRLCVGSSTISLFMASGIVLPIVQQSGVSPELMVLAVATGSVFGGPPTEPCFWLVKEFFNLELKEQFYVWCCLCTLIAVVGIAGVMVLSMFVV